MQELIWEAAWDRTIAAKDRQMYEELFHAESNQFKRFIPVKEAVNHKGDLLITVIVQNFTDVVERWGEVKMSYIEGNQIIAEQLFSHHQLMIPPKKSMPWTFIFSDKALRMQPQFNGELIEK